MTDRDAPPLPDDLAASVPHESDVDPPPAVELVVDGDTDNDTSAGPLPPTDRAPPRVVRGRYAKFTAAMDVVMLETLRTHNPFTAKHGTRLEMWRLIAEAVGEATMKNPEAYSWHTCRDRVTTLMNMYADGKHDKLFKHGTIEENARKETILRELHVLLNRKGAKPGTHVRAPTLLEARLTTNPLLLTTGESAVVGLVPAGAAAGSGHNTRPPATRASSGGQGAPKRRRQDANGYAQAGSIDTETFRTRVLELMETKIHFDMEQRAKENELREQEFELQKRFLEYLQSK